MSELREPYSSDNVRTIVEKIPQGTEDLKGIVTERVREVTGIHGNLPERIKTWIHQLCRTRIQGEPYPQFFGKLANPIDLASLPSVQRTKKPLT